MSLLEAFIASLVQGLTEFLPVSSSGHLLILNYLFGVPEVDLTFFIYLHFITLIITVVFFFKTLIGLEANKIYQILLASIPVIIVGAFSNALIHRFSHYQVVVSIFLLITAGINYLIYKLQMESQYSKSQKKNDKKLTYYDAIKVGCTQVLALFPGVSRSAMTIWAGMKVGLNQERAFDFAFLLSIPVIAGANFYEVIRMIMGNRDKLMIKNSVWIYILAGFITAFFSYLSLKMLQKIMKKAKFHYFAYYCLTLAVFNFGIVIF